jgi:hypothetical protein
LADHREETRPTDRVGVQLLKKSMKPAPPPSCVANSWTMSPGKRTKYTLTTRSLVVTAVWRVAAIVVTPLTMIVSSCVAAPGVKMRAFPTMMYLPPAPGGTVSLSLLGGTGLKKGPVSKGAATSKATGMVAPSGRGWFDILMMRALRSGLAPVGPVQQGPVGPLEPG